MIRKAASLIAAAIYILSFSNTAGNTELANTGVDLIETFTPSAPLSFIANQGQFQEQVNFYTDAGGIAIWFLGDNVYYHFSRFNTTRSDSTAALTKYHNAESSRPDSVSYLLVKASFVGANASPRIYGVEERGFKFNYLKGSSPRNWTTGVPAYRQIVYENIYDGINLKYYGNSDRMEYDFAVSPNADPTQINVEYEGIRNLYVDTDGNLVIETDFGSIVEKRPVIYQLDGDIKIPIEGEYEFTGTSSFRFKLGDAYDPRLPLIIDPVLEYGTFLGGSSNDYGMSSAFDLNGNLSIAGYVNSVDFPLTDAFDSVLSATTSVDYDIFIAKISPNGDSLLYSTYIGGTGDDRCYAIALDSFGNNYLTGLTTSSDFPINSAAQPASGGSKDAYVLKLNTSGNDLVYSTYLGGSEDDIAIDLDLGLSLEAVVVGRTGSTSFPASGALDETLDGPADAFISRISADGGQLVFSTFYGGSGPDAATAVAVGSDDRIVVCGYSLSSDLPLVNAFDVSYNGGVAFGDAFIAGFTADGESMICGTYLGGNADDVAADLALDRDDAVYLTGSSYSSNFPLAGPFQGYLAGSYDIFVTKLANTGTSLVYSTYIGGALGDFGAGISIDNNNYAYITGNSFSTSFPVVSAFDGTYNGGIDAIAACLTTSGSQLVFSTFIGGTLADFGYSIGIDSDKHAYLAGYTNSFQFPTADPVQTDTAGGFDAFALKMLVFDAFCIDSDDDGLGDPGHLDNQCPDDNCPEIFNPEQTDSDSDGTGDPCDNCPDLANPTQQDTDLDGIGDDCDSCTDTDGDSLGNPGFAASTCLPDNCPEIYNPLQIDNDGDGVGDECDDCTDTDADGFGSPYFPANTCLIDNCPNIANPLQEDEDLDGAGDICDNCLGLYNPEQKDSDGDSIGDSCDVCTDTDGDGFGNPGFPTNTCQNDNCPYTFNPGQEDSNLNGIGDVCDIGCCTPPIRGNVDGDSEELITIADLIYMVSYFFGSGPPAPCPDEINVDGDSLETIDIADMLYMVDFMFGTGKGPAECPPE